MREAEGHKDRERQKLGDRETGTETEKYSWAWGLLCSVVFMPSDTALEKSEFSHPSRYQ